MKLNKLKKISKTIRNNKQPKYNRAKRHFKFMAKVFRRIQYDPFTGLPQDVGLNAIMEQVHRDRKNKPELGEFQKHYNSLITQMKLRDPAEVLFFFRSVLARENIEDFKMGGTNIFLKCMMNDVVPNFKETEFFAKGLTKSQIIEQVAIYLSYKNLQRKSFIEEKKKDQHTLHKEFWSEDPLFKKLDPEVQLAMQEELVDFNCKSQADIQTDEFKDFDFDGLIGNELYGISSEMQKYFFFKKAMILPEILGISPKKLIRIKKRNIKPMSELTKSLFIKRTPLHNDNLTLKQYQNILGYTDKDMAHINYRAKKTNQQEFDSEEDDELLEKRPEKIRQLEEDVDFTSIKEILYSYDSIKTLDNKISRLERDAKLYSTTQPEIQELEKQLEMMFDNLPENIRNIFNINFSDKFKSKYIGHQHNTKDLRWKMIDLDLPTKVIDYTDSIPNLTYADLRLMTPYEINTYWNEKFPLLTKDDIVTRVRDKTIDLDNVTLSSNEYLKDIYNDMNVDGDGNKKKINHEAEKKARIQEELDIEQEIEDLRKEAEEKGHIFNETQWRNVITQKYKVIKYYNNKRKKAKEDMKNLNKKELPLLTEMKKTPPRLDKRDSAFYTETQMSIDDRPPTQEEIDEFKFLNPGYILNKNWKVLDPFGKVIDNLEGPGKDKRKIRMNAYKVEDYNPTPLNTLRSIVQFDNISAGMYDFDMDGHKFFDDYDTITKEREGKMYDFDEEIDPNDSKKPKNIFEMMSAAYNKKYQRRMKLRKGRLPSDLHRDSTNYVFNNPYNINHFEDNRNLPERYEIDKRMGYPIDTITRDELIEGITHRSEKKQTVDFENKKAMNSLDRDYLNKVIFNQKLEDFMDTRYFEFHIPEVLEHDFYRIQKQMALKFTLAECNVANGFAYNSVYDDEIEKENGEELNELEEIPEVTAAFEYLMTDFMTLLKKDCAKHQELVLDKREKAEVELVKKMNNDVFYKHYMATTFKHLSEYNSEMFLDTMSQLNNPDIGMLHDTRMDVVKLLSNMRRPKTLVDRMNERLGIDGKAPKGPKKYSYIRGSKINSFGTGKRKRSSALAVITYPGTGKITINRREFIEYFPDLSHRFRVINPIISAGLHCEIDLKIYVHGGGTTGQGYAAGLATAVSIKKMFPNLEKYLIKAKTTFCDTRVVEGKKTGKYKARKAYTYVRR